MTSDHGSGDTFPLCSMFEQVSGLQFGVVVRSTQLYFAARRWELVISFRLMELAVRQLAEHPTRSQSRATSIDQWKIRSILLHRYQKHSIHKCHSSSCSRSARCLQVRKYVKQGRPGIKLRSYAIRHVLVTARFSRRPWLMQEQVVARRNLSSGQN